MHSQNPLTILEMEEILFVVRTLEKLADLKALPSAPKAQLRQAVGQAKYALQDAIERRASA